MEIKTCCDCRHVKDGRYSWATCKARSESTQPDMITGKRYVRSNTCEWMRGDRGDCGPDGKLWAPSFWYQVKQVVRKIAGNKDGN